MLYGARHRGGAFAREWGNVARQQSDRDERCNSDARVFIALLLCYLFEITGEEDPPAPPLAPLAERLRLREEGCSRLTVQHTRLLTRPARLRVRDPSVVSVLSREVHHCWQLVAALRSTQTVRRGVELRTEAGSARSR